MEEKEITTFKPSTGLYIFLFIFYSIWLLQAYGAICFYIESGFEEFTKYGINEWLIMPLFCFAGIYSVFAVIKTLRGDSDCITALKWALMYSFLYTLFNSQRAQIPTYNIAAFLSVFLARPLFYLTFYLYLCFSKSIRHRYPKLERRFAPSGWVWSGITLCLVAICVYMGYEMYQTNLYCKRTNPSKIVLLDGEVTDGLVAFKSSRKWMLSKENIDTVLVDEKMFCPQTMESIDSLTSIILFSGRSEKHDVRLHNQVLPRFFGQVEEDVVESGFTDTIADGKRLVVTTFMTKPGLEEKRFIVATIFDLNSPKSVVLASKERGKYDDIWLNEIFQSLRWDLKSVSDTKHKKDGSDKKNDVAGRTGNSDKKSDADMFASLLNGRTPGLLFGVMLLEHHKREIAYSQGYRPLY